MTERCQPLRTPATRQPAVISAPPAGRGQQPEQRAVEHPAHQPEAQLQRQPDQQVAQQQAGQKQQRGALQCIAATGPGPSQDDTARLREQFDQLKRPTARALRRARRRRRIDAMSLLQLHGEPGYVVLPAGIVKVEGLAAREGRERGRHRRRRRHARALDQHRNHWQSGGQRRLDLAPHRVLRVVQAQVALRVAYVGPARTDHRQHDTGAADRARQRRLEIQAGRDRVDVAEHTLGPEQCLQPIGQTAGGTAAVVAAVAEKDVGHCRKYRLGFLPCPAKPLPPLVLQSGGSGTPGKSGGC